MSISIVAIEAKTLLCVIIRFPLIVRVREGITEGRISPGLESGTHGTVS
jgi:hypothetical protein